MGEGEKSKDIGVGAILGAPFMLTTLAFTITALAAIIWRRRRRTGARICVSPVILSRDLRYFFPMYIVAISASWLPAGPARWLVCLFLLLSYAYYVKVNLAGGDAVGGAGSPLRLHMFWARLSLTRLPEETREAFLERCHNHTKECSHTGFSIAQVGFSLLVMLGGAKLFVHHVELLSGALGASPLMVALIVAPIATELPEKFNSVLWMRQGKDTLALGNITGAMVFQSSIPVTLGIALTDWKLHGLPGHGHLPLISAGIALFSAGFLLSMARRKRNGGERCEFSPWVLLIGLPLYLLFILAVMLKW
jgi:cation:H+ antiporter